MINEKPEVKDSVKLQAEHLIDIFAVPKSEKHLQAIRLFAKITGKRYIFLGQTFAAVSFFDLLDFKIKYFSYHYVDTIRKAPPEVIEHWIAEGRMTREEVGLPVPPERTEWCFSDDYREYMKLIFPDVLFPEPADFDGKGLSGRGLNAEEKLYIREKFGYEAE